MHERERNLLVTLADRSSRIVTRVDDRRQLDALALDVGEHDERRASDEELSRMRLPEAHPELGMEFEMRDELKQAVGDVGGVLRTAPFPVRVDGSRSATASSDQTTFIERAIAGAPGAQ